MIKVIKLKNGKLTAEFTDEYASTVLVSQRQYRKDVLVEDVLFLARHQTIVVFRVLHLERVISLDLQTSVSHVIRRSKSNLLIINTT